MVVQLQILRSLNMLTCTMVKNLPDPCASQHFFSHLLSYARSALQAWA